MICPLISVVVPVYNTARFLPRCLDSLLAQTYGKLEVLCVNDGSVDESAQILASYAERDSRVRVITQTNSGLSAARNVALDAACGDYISFVDSDDFVKPQLYEKILPSLEDAEVDVVWFGNEVVCSHETELKVKCEAYFAQPLSGKESCRPGIIGWKTFCVWGKIYRRSLIEQFGVRFPEGALYEDLCFNWQFFGIARAIWFLPEKLYCYELHESGIMSSGRRGDIEPACEYWKLLSPACEFYQKNKLLPNRRGMFFHFLLRLYGAAQHYASLPYKSVFRRALIFLVKKNKWVEMLPQHELWSRLLTDEFPRLNLRSLELRLIGLSIWQRVVTESSVTYSVFGIPLISLAYSFDGNAQPVPQALIRRVCVPSMPPPKWKE